ncbi:hypothetical protein MSAN_01911900 [Mycena sanguinolenta]|uniref:Uncharacterized protein n=1 Tax=Mycena sanguinolenta TaxID=230812 RepID=A0A8H6XMA6_9AGAR|nr:hypothetical protein MSAN_01911900 [Mycena sanguinolenta]
MAKYDTQSSLSKHQAKCKHVTAADPSLDDALAKRHARKRRKTETQHITVGLSSAVTAQSSTNITQASDDFDMSDAPPISEPDMIPSEPDVNNSDAPESAPVPGVLPQILATGRPPRTRRPTWKLLQRQPEMPAEPVLPPIAEDDTDRTPPPTISAYVWKAVKTVQNSFGLSREYPSVPTHDPDKLLNPPILSNIPPPAGQADAVDSRLAPPTTVDTVAVAARSWDSLLGPFKNSTIFGLMNWMWTGSPMKSIQEMVKLVSFLKSNQFNKANLEGFDIAAETSKFDALLEGSGEKSDGSRRKHFTTSPVKDGWREVSIDIQVPDGKTHLSYDDVPVFSVPGLHLRNLTEVIKVAVQDRSSRFFHYTPFKQFWKENTTNEGQRVYDEIYTADAFITAHEKLQRQPPEPGCTLEHIILALMFWSDSTHLANFGTASLWPLYLFFGNQSKWVHGKPRAGACHHVAYMPKLPDDFND